MEELQEKTLKREQAVAETRALRTSYSELDRELMLAIECAIEKKASDLLVLDLRQIASFTEFFAIVSGMNQRQVQAISDEIRERLKNELGRRPIRIEGYASAEWVLLDYGDFIFHIFDKEAREFYDLERLWRDASRVELPVNEG
jgi:ribosome-associated protein